MAPLYLCLALILQCSLIFANDEDVQDQPHRESLIKPTDEAIPEFRATDTEWLDLFMLPKGVHTSSSAAKMSQVTSSDKPVEEQLEDIKEIANQITLAIQSEMANLLSYALRDADKEMSGENNLRRKRSAESPMDSTQLVMRLLKHIKSNNEYQNIAIEKMMSAQEIADKFGIEFNPDPEILTDFAVASNKQAEELSSILRDASNAKNSSTIQEIEFIPINNEPVEYLSNNTYYNYSTDVPEREIIAQQNAAPDFEYIYLEPLPEPRSSHMHYEPMPQYNYPMYPHETQIVSPPVQHPYHAPVSYMSNFFEPAMFTPAPEYYPPYYPMEPVTTTTTIILPIEESLELEPELVGEEFEETVTSKVYVDRGDEPGSATVNHVMTYTIAEKSHFKTPEIEKLPQQMQYYFFLM